MLSKRVKQSALKESQRHEKDTGSAEAQIGLLTKQIKALSLHLKKHSKDHHSRRGLLMMVGKRRKFLKYLQESNEKTHDRVVKKLGLDA